jgi:hypothetical protein
VVAELALRRRAAAVVTVWGVEVRVVVVGQHLDQPD